MGRNMGAWVEYNCNADCEETGCPGHKVRYVVCRSSDVESFEFEGGREKGKVLYFDANQLEAMLKAVKA